MKNADKNTVKGSKTLADFAYQKIRNDIISGELEADEKLRLSNLCKRYEIGMSPLREALARHIGDALVITEGQRGFWVAPLSIEELEDISRVRILLESEALQLSITNADDGWRNLLTDAFEQLTRVETELDGRNRDKVPEWEQANSRFHETLVARCGSQWLQRMLKILHQQAERYRRISLVKANTGRDLHEEHEALYQAAMQGNVLKACRLLEIHVGLTSDAVRDALTENLAT